MDRNLLCLNKALHFQLQALRKWKLPPHPTQVRVTARPAHRHPSLQQSPPRKLRWRWLMRLWGLFIAIHGMLCFPNLCVVTKKSFRQHAAAFRGEQTFSSAGVAIEWNSELVRPFGLPQGLDFRRGLTAVSFNCMCMMRLSGNKC